MKAIISRRASRAASTVACGVLLLAPALARAELDCIAPTRVEGYEAHRPGAARLLRAAEAAAAITQRNAVFMAGDQPVRVRTTINFHGIEWMSASVITSAYNRTAWLNGGCRISKNADRGGNLRDGTLAIFINSPDSIMNSGIGDGELRAGFTPKPMGTMAGFPVYASGGEVEKSTLLLSENGYLPWVPVTVAEMLAWQERDLVKHEAGLKASEQELASGGFDEKKIDEIYRSMKQVNPAEAEKGRAQMLASLQKARARAAQDQDKGTRVLGRQRAAFESYRASLSPAQLAAPGSLSIATTRDGAVRVDDPQGRGLARIDPGYAKRDPNRIHLVMVYVGPQPKTDPHYAWHQASLQALDYAALNALLGK